MRDSHDDYEPLPATNYEDFPRVLPRYARRLRYDTAKESAPVEKIGRAPLGTMNAISMSDEAERYRQCLRDVHADELSKHGREVRADFDEAPYRTTHDVIELLLAEGFNRHSAVKYIHNETSKRFNGQQ
jgi:hypothetical protein